MAHNIHQYCTNCISTVSYSSPKEELCSPLLLLWVWCDLWQSSCKELQLIPVKLIQRYNVHERKCVTLMESGESDCVMVLHSCNMIHVQTNLDLQDKPRVAHGLLNDKSNKKWTVTCLLVHQVMARIFYDIVIVYYMN